MDAQQILKKSRLFYRDHGLDAWRHAMPKKAALNEGDTALVEAEHQGFTESFAFPPFRVQMDTLATLVEETAAKHAAGLPDNRQYRAEPFLADTWTKTPNGKVLQRGHDLAGRDEAPYLLLLMPQPCAAAWGRTGKQIGELFALKGWQGLTVPEYFVLQRIFAEAHGNHRFFPDGGEDEWEHRLWLLDSMTANECSVVMARSGDINVQACPLGNRDARRAAVAARVVPLAA